MTLSRRLSPSLHSPTMRRTHAAPRPAAGRPAEMHDPGARSRVGEHAWQAAPVPAYIRRPMEFGLFIQAHLPSHELAADPVGAEHSRLMREVELAEACDRAGFKYIWSVEHHFLEEYSHLSASEIVLPFIAARTKRIHVGSAIWNLTPPVNHPARVAERVAMLDHLSEGRFEFGTGRGSSSTEFKGFGIPDGDTTREMFDESLGEILRMWRDVPYSHDGRFFSMPPRNVLPKPWTRPHPPLWMACGSPSTFEKAARLGVGALCFSL